ncbi:hypothetical protein, partial [Paraburkholderia sp. RL17-381-BIF-C]|uniref:hypothetical protein n=1 Tax=Paraburkholderia sp. RL17-381-BIF-C TaxID=3031635 RepID=UPI0038B7E727
RQPAIHTGQPPDFFSGDAPPSCSPTTPEIPAPANIPLRFFVAERACSFSLVNVRTRRRRRPFAHL